MKPLYVIKIDSGYYSGDSAWRPVSRDKASKVPHKDAYRIRGKLKRLGYTAVVEPA